MTPVASTRHALYDDMAAIRAEFPILRRRVHGRPLVYLDNAATTQKPQVVIDRIVRYYGEENANVHRGVHQLSADATDACEAARETGAAVPERRGRARDRLRARHDRGDQPRRRDATAARRSGPGDEVVSPRWSTTPTSCRGRCSAKRRAHACASSRSATRASCDSTSTSGCSVRARASWRSRTSRTRWARSTRSRRSSAWPTASGIPVLVDGAQAVAHMPVDVQALGCDFYAFSGHKVFGPTGIGVLYGRARCLPRCRRIRAAAT